MNRVLLWAERCSIDETIHVHDIVDAESETEFPDSQDHQ